MFQEKAAAIKAAKAAGQFQLDHFTSSYQIWEKAPRNLVTEIDIQSQKIILEILNNSCPGIPALSEEDVASSRGSGHECWIIDPLDGTTNFSHGYPLFAVSIALERNGEIVLGVVYAPVLDKLFCAVRGQGAKVNDKDINVSQITSLENSLLATGFPYDAWTNELNNARECVSLIKKIVSIRSDGVSALDLCFVASGVIDGYWELDLEPWDMAAGSLIVQEAGGTVTLATGEPFSPYQRSILASNTHLHKMIQRELSASRLE
jgi:myo-inositol-1(or 4)-monophosphatase